MEETIGYEALFSGEEWDAIQSGDYSSIDEEGELAFSASPYGDRDETPHEVTLYEQGTGFELECGICGCLGEADTIEQAQAIVRLHEVFVATVVKSWGSERWLISLSRTWAIS